VRSNHNIPDALFTEDMFGFFRRLGYKTALIGKNHSHLKSTDADVWHEYNHFGYMGSDATPAEVAFREHIRAQYGMYFGSEPNPFPLELQNPCGIVSKAVKFIDGAGEQPFFAWVSIPEPHNPYQVCEPYYSMYAGKLPAPRTTRDVLRFKGFKYLKNYEYLHIGYPTIDADFERARENYHGMLTLIDDQMKRLYGHLCARGLERDTLFIFLADHGEFCGEYGLLKKGPECSEFLCHVPFQITGPGVVPGRYRPLVSLCDLFPTLCEALGEKIPDGVQGRSLWPMLTGQPYPEAEFESICVEQGFGGRHYDRSDDDRVDATKDGLTPGHAYDCLNSRTQSGILRALRWENYKLLFDMMGVGQLYDLDADPLETKTCLTNPQCAPVRAQMAEKLLAWCLRAQDPLPLPRSRYTYKGAAHNYWFE